MDVKIDVYETKVVEFYVNLNVLGGWIVSSTVGGWILS